MKLAATALIMTTLATAPAVGQSNEEILKRLDAIERRLDTLEALPNVGTLLLEQVRKNVREVQQTNAGKSGKGDMAEAKPKQPKFSARLVSIKPGRNEYGRLLYDLKVEVTNESGRDASLINAYVVFVDRLGNTLIRLPWEKSRGIAAGKSVKMSGSFRDVAAHGLERMTEMDPSLFETQFEVYKIAYKDGEVVTLKECSSCDF